MRKLKQILGSFLLIILFGFPVSVMFFQSFGIPDFHHGNLFRLIFAGTIVFGIPVFFAFRYLRRFMLRCFSGLGESILTQLFTLLIALALWLGASPYTYVETRVKISPVNPTENISVKGVYPSRLALPLVAPYSFSPADFAKQQSVEEVILGEDGFQELYFSISPHKLREGAYIDYTPEIPLKVEYINVDIPPYIMQSSSEILPVPDKILQLRQPYSLVAFFTALPGLLFLSLLIGVYIRKLVYLLLWMPSRLPVHIVFLLSVAGFILSYILLPFDFTSDASYQLQQALSGEYGDWHPPIMAFIWIQLVYLSQFLTDSFSIVESWCLLFRLPYWVGFFFLGRYGVKRAGLLGGTAIMLVAYMPLYFEKYYVFFGAALKDWLLVSCYILTLGLLLNFPFVKKRSVKLLFWTGALIFFIIGTGIRSNAMSAALPLSCLFFIPFFNAGTIRGIIKAAVCGILLLAVIVSSIYVFHYSVLNAARQNPLSYSMFKEILAIRTLSGDTEWPAFLSQKMRDDFDKNYNYQEHNGGVDIFLHGELGITHLSNEHYEELKSFWIRKVKEHPKEYMMQKWDSFSRLLGGGKPTLVSKWWMLFFVTVFCTIVSFFLLFTQKYRQKSLIVFLLGLSGLMYLSAYFILALAAPLRYISWFMYAGTLSIVLFILLFMKTASSKNSDPNFDDN